MTDTPLPIEDIFTPVLDVWEARLGDGWDTWIAPRQRFRVHVELIDLEVPPDEVLTGFEIRLDDCRMERPYPVVARETVRNAHLALELAHLLAADAERYADEWHEGLAPRPEDVEYLSDDGGDSRAN